MSVLFHTFQTKVSEYYVYVCTSGYGGGVYLVLCAGSYVCMWCNVCSCGMCVHTTTVVKVVPQLV